MKIADFLVRTQSEGCGLVGMSARLVATGIGKGGRVGGLADEATVIPGPTAQVTVHLTAWETAVWQEEGRSRLGDNGV